MNINPPGAALCPQQCPLQRNEQYIARLVAGSVPKELVNLRYLVKLKLGNFYVK